MKQKWKQFSAGMKALFHYLAALGLAVIFALYCSGRVGWFLALMFVLAPVLSVAYTWCIARFLTITFEQSGEVLTKGEKCTVTVKIQNRSMLPTPPVGIVMMDSPALTASVKKFYTEVLPFQTAVEKIEFTGKMSGASQIGIREIGISDFFSLLNKRVELPKNQKSSWMVGIVPDIAEIPFEGDYIREVSQCALGNDESEETMEYSSAVFGGFPGYDHRVYQPGDPIKRINWKLSAGNEELFVRLDEVKAGAGVTLILDPCMYSTGGYGNYKVSAQYRNLSADESAALLKQNTIEDALGHVRVLIARELSVNFYVKQNGVWSLYVINEENQLSELTRQLATVSFSGENEERIPQEVSSGETESTAILYCTPILGAELATVLQACKHEDVSLAIYVTVSEEGVVL